MGCSVHTGCDIATPEQVMLGEGLPWAEREENAVGKGVSVQILRPTSEPQCENFCFSVTSQIMGKMPKFSNSSGDPTQRGEVSFD